MTRIISSGFEQPGIYYPFKQWNMYSPTEWTTGLSGSFAMHIRGNESRWALLDFPYLFPDDVLTDIYVRARIQILGDAAPGYLMNFSTPQTANLFRLYIPTLGGTAISLIVNGTTRCTSNVITWSKYAWGLVEIHLKLDSTDGMAELRVNGQKVSWTGNTIPNSDTRISQLLFGWTSGYNNSYKLDDFAINTPDGDRNNSWCGAGKIIQMKPNGDGDLTEWTPLSGQNYTMVDENTNPHDSFTTVVRTAEDGKIDFYNMTAPFIPSGYDIDGIRVFCAARKSFSAFDDRIHLGFKSGDIIEWNKELIPGTDYVFTSTFECPPTDYYETNPDTNKRWTAEDLNGLQVGIKSILES